MKIFDILLKAHTDGPAYTPVVCTVTTGGGQTLIIRNMKSKEIIDKGKPHRFFRENFLKSHDV